LMDVTIGFLMLLMFWKGIESNPAVAFIMVFLAVISLILLRSILKQPVLKFD